MAKLTSLCLTAWVVMVTYFQNSVSFNPIQVKTASESSPSAISGASLPTTLSRVGRRIIQHEYEIINPNLSEVPNVLPTLVTMTNYLTHDINEKNYSTAKHLQYLSSLENKYDSTVPIISNPIQLPTLIQTNDLTTYETITRINNTDDVSLPSTLVAPVPIFPAAPTPRNDSPLEKVAIYLLSWTLARVVNDKEEVKKFVYPGMDFKGFVTVTKFLLKGSAEDIKIKVVGILLGLIPTFLRKPIFEFCQRNPKWISEKSATFMGFGVLGWLVGPTEKFTMEIPSSINNEETEIWQSGIKLTECRYLVASGCKSACLHLCKGPTESFFNEELGLSLHMKPNFKDCSCEMFFGMKPPPVEKDDSYGQPCFTTCSMKEYIFPPTKKKSKSKLSLSSPSTSTMASNDLISIEEQSNDKHYDDNNPTTDDVHDNSQIFNKCS